MNNHIKRYNLLVEGPDCSGKSTVVERLKNLLHWDAKSLHHQEGDQFKRYVREYALADNVVFDRGHFSEEVYSRLWRGGSPFLPQQKNILNALCQQMMIVIFVSPPLEIIQQRYQQRAFEQQIQFQELEQSRVLFCETMKEVPHILYASQDYEELEALLEKVKEVIQYETLCPAGGTGL